MNPFGFNFRSTLAYVTDPADCYAAAFFERDPAYPTTVTINGVSVTFGYEVAFDSTLDRSAAVDARLAGFVYRHNGDGISTWRVDLPDGAGSYDIRLALGDATAARSITYQIRDTTASLHAIVEQEVASGSFLDATDTARTAAAWPAGNVAATYTFATSIFRLDLCQSGTNALASTLAHLYIAKAGAPPAGVAIPVMQNYYRQMRG